MALSLAQGSNNTGVASPATPGSLTPTTGDLMLLFIGVIGTSPTITTPTNWTPIQTQFGSVMAIGLYALPAASGAQNPSAALGGTVTGWIACMFDFTGQGSSSQYEANQGSNVIAATSNNVAGFFPSQSLPMTNMLLFYSICRQTATYTPANSGLNWSATQQAASANGLAVDSFWATNPGPGPFPVAGGSLSASVVWKGASAWFNTINAQPVTTDNIGGNLGVYVPTFYQGMIGG